MGRSDGLRRHGSSGRGRAAHGLAAAPTAARAAAAKAEEAASLLLRLGGRATDVPSDDTDSANPDAASDIALAA